MSLFFADLVRELSRSTGAGDFALEGAVPGHRRFTGVVPAGARFCYTIAGVTNPGEWEVGEGEIGSGGALVRAPLASSAGGGLVAFSAGLKTVALTVGASWFAEQDQGAADVAALQAAVEDKADLGHDHDGVYQPIDAGLTAIAALASMADRLPYFTGPESAALTTLTAFGRGLIDDADPATARVTLGLGSAATRNTGTSGANLPLLDGANSWSAAQTVAGAVTLSTSGVDIAAGARLVTPSMRCEASNPSITIKDTDSAGAAMTGYFHFWDSGSVTTARIGRPFGDGNLWIENAGGAIHFGLAIGTSAAQLNAASFDLLGARVFRVAGTQVLGPRIGGWNAATGTASRSAFDTATVSTAALAERVKALIDDLRTHGLIGN